MRTRATLVAALFIVGILPAPTSAAPPDCKAENLKRVLSLDQKSYTTDESVRMRMVVKNVGPPCRMVFMGGQTHSFYVFEDDKKIWDKSACMAFHDAIVYETWEHGHREVYRVRWRGWKNGMSDGSCKRRIEKAGPGRYEAQARFMGDGAPRTSRLTFRVSR